MSSKHIETRRKLKEIYQVQTFEDLINRCILTDSERSVLRLHYLESKDFQFIGDELGFAESTIKKKHSTALKKLNKLL